MFEFDEDLVVGDLPFMAGTPSNKWIDMAFQLKSLRIEEEKKPWSKAGEDVKVHYIEMNHGDDQGWHEEELPFWGVKIFMDFAAEHGTRKGDLKCQYMRIEYYNADKKRDESKASFRFDE